MDQSSYLIITAVAFVAIGFILYQKSKGGKAIKGEVKVVKNQAEQEEVKGEVVDMEKEVDQIENIKVRTQEELEKEYEGTYYRPLRLKPANSVHSITAVRFKNSKILIATSKNEMIMYDLKTWKKESSAPEKYFTSLGNNGASALDMSEKFYYVALSFDKTIAIYEFKGGENKTYFKEFKTFPRNILKSEASSLHVSPNEKYIITTGSGADTVVDVWSMSGQRIANANSYQIQHYEISCGTLDILIRGWTSQVKVFGAVEDKDGNFKKLDKKAHLPNEQSPLSSVIDNRDMFALSINQHHKVKLWWLFDTYHKEVESTALDGKKFTKARICTFESGFGRFKPLIILSHAKGFTIADQNLEIIKEIIGVEIQDLLVTGTSKRVIIGTMNSHGQLHLWNISKQLQAITDITL